jgi:hypothetical protein
MHFAAFEYTYVFEQLHSIFTNYNYTFENVNYLAFDLPFLSGLQVHFVVLQNWFVKTSRLLETIILES